MAAIPEPSGVAIGDLCGVGRTKNAGPFLFALDLMFAEPDVYRAVKERGLVTRSTIAEAYGVPLDQVVNLEHYDEVASIKAVVRRPIVAGSPGDRDCYSMNQEVPALRIRVPLVDAHP